MLSFLVRRLIGAFLVLVAVSFITYLIFVKIPGGDPAPRIAGRLATDQNIADIRQKLHLNDPFYRQYWAMMQSLFTGTLKSYSSQLNVVTEIKRGIPATLSLTIGAGIIWLGFGILVGVISAVTAGGLSDRVITVLALADLYAAAQIAGAPWTLLLDEFGGVMNIAASRALEPGFLAAVLAP